MPTGWDRAQGQAERAEETAFFGSISTTARMNTRGFVDGDDIQ
ncbi:hypothetical protein HNQ09_001729 [Deinococcus budaensis]|uniref:Uncharacterized protein n=1 Tax=Deinococcus budaensis TaxID=1665626 RepID=A0A7W8LPZ7_9DEIO|nr:hypothetical protein [Deinococcus budaensis]